jgi:glycosyltransferase involved in cell wall biosynthesis
MNSSSNFPFRPAKLKVLVKNRPNALTQSGGDTVLMVRTIEGLRALDNEVVLDLEGRYDPREFDLVHLFNFALPELLRAQAEQCVNLGVPYVVTTLCEDIPSFLYRSWEAFKLLLEYVSRNQDQDWLKAAWPSLNQNSVPIGRLANDWVAQHAAALIVNGKAEANIVGRDYPFAASKIKVVPVGFDACTIASPDLFVSTYGIKDFILCVGRLETRKNQLLLLKALEDSELPLVFASSGFTYHPDYERAAQAFRRKGRTLFLERLSPQMLASAYAACRIHALPSWYELPGLVSLEAASYGKNVVLSDTGTSADYFGQGAFYCEPDNWRATFNALIAAYYSPVDPALSEHVRQFSWERAAQETLKVYQSIVDKNSSKFISARAFLNPIKSPLGILS